jgi:hypothetical protein
MPPRNTTTYPIFIRFLFSLPALILERNRTPGMSRALQRVSSMPLLGYHAPTGVILSKGTTSSQKTLQLAIHRGNADVVKVKDVTNAAWFDTWAAVSR